MALIYQSKTLSWTQQPNICNTSNHVSELTSEEHFSRVMLTYKNKWVSKFPDPKGTITIRISPAQCEMLSKAAFIGFMSGKRSPLYQDELNDFEHVVDNVIKTDNLKWFIRLNECSPKDGIYGCGPLTSAQQIVTSLVTSGRAYRALARAHERGYGNTLYIVPWRDNWKEELEFRVFVNKQHITAISQYVWCKDVGWKADTICNVVPKIVTYCNEEVIPKMDIDSFVVDVIVIYDEDGSFHVELIELNSFGQDLAAGAALFHWINDHDILYGDGKEIIIRYVTN